MAPLTRFHVFYRNRGEWNHADQAFHNIELTKKVGNGTVENEARRAILGVCPDLAL